MVNLVIPAAGLATRLKPLSTQTSKIMLRINGKPCLDYIIEEFRKNADISSIVIVDGKFDDIREYCSDKHPDIIFVKQPSLDGPRDAVTIGINTLKEPSKPLVVWLGDAIITEKDLPLGENFLLCKDVEDQSSWAMWDGATYWNKPEFNVPNAHALVGLYSFQDGNMAKESFNGTDKYDISYALELYQKAYPFNKILTEYWYDIGELQTYYKTCARLLNKKSRVFNNLVYDATIGSITKIPDYHNQTSIQKIKNEKSWYLSLKNKQSFFTPRIMKDKNELTMSYEAGTLLSDLMLYDNLSSSVWEYILDKVLKIKQNFFEMPINNEFENFAQESKMMWLCKTQERLSKIMFTKHEKSKLMDIAEDLCFKTRPISGMHGDLHLGNILYNQTTDQIKFIDPRGQYGSIKETILGDNLYDYCKLSHDILHNYNALQNNIKPNETIKKVFIKLIKKYNLPLNEIERGGLLLLATCIPLHYEDKDRQNRFRVYVQSKL